MVGDFCIFRPFCNTIFQSGYKGVSDSRNGERLVRVFSCEPFVCCPSIESKIRIRGRSYTGIIYNPFELVHIQGVGRLHVIGDRITGDLLKVHLQAGIFVTSGHDIDGKRVCREGDGVVGRGDRGHKFVAFGTLVIDVHQLAIYKRGVRDGHQRGLPFLRLPLGVTVRHGDVVRTDDRFSSQIGALHGRCRHRGQGGEVSLDREVERAPAVCGMTLARHHFPHLGSLVRLVVHERLALVLRHGKRVDTHQQHKHDAEEICERFSHRLWHTVNFFHLGIKALVHDCRFSHNVYTFYLLFLISHFCASLKPYPTLS